MATTEQKFIFRFEEGDASMRDLLGGKGANLCEMARMGLAFFNSGEGTA